MSSFDSNIRFKDIPDWPGYRASDDGRIWSCWSSAGGQTDKWHEINTTLPDGYRWVFLRKNGYKERFHVARLILMTFVGPCLPGMQACHFPDKDRGNCRLDNLIWGTHQTNIDHREIQGSNPKGSQKHNAKMTEDDVREIVRLRMAGARTKDVAAQFGIPAYRITHILKGDCWKHVEIPRGLTRRLRINKPEEVREIRQLSAGGLRHKEIAEKFGIHASIISRIVNRKVFANID